MKAGIPAAMGLVLCIAPPLIRTGAAQTPRFRSDIVVTPERGSDDRDRLPVSTAVLTRPEIERTPATSLADLIQALPGFHLVLGEESGFAPAPIARGFFGGGEAEYLKLLVDGIPINDAESGLVDWRMLPASAIDRIEALRGPASAVYGDSALGGVIQAFTMAPDGTIGRVEVGGGSFGARNLRGQISHPFGRAALSAIGSFGSANGFRTRSGLREGFTSASLRHVRETRQWTVRGSFNYLTREEPGALTGAQLSSDRAQTDPLFDGDADTNRRGHAAIRFASQAGRLQYSILGHVNTRAGERVRTLLLAPGLGDRARRDISTSNAGVSLENTIALFGGGENLRFGVDIARSEVDTAYRALDQENRPGSQTGAFGGQRLQLAGYATHWLDLGTRVRVHGGVRWDRLHDRVDGATRASHDAWSPRLAAAVLVAGAPRTTTAFAQVSRAFKAPTLDQLFDPRPFPDFSGGTFLVSNPALEPQHAGNIEGGVRQSSAAYRWELVVYRMAVDNEIDFDPATFSYANIDRSTHAGVELDAQVFRRSRVAAAFSYAWTRVIPDEPSVDARQLKNIPRHLFRPELTVTLPRETMLHVRYSRTAGAFADDQNLFPLNGRSTVDLRLARRLRRLTARLDLLNLTNDRYEDVGFTLSDFRGGIVPFYYPAQGFSVRAGLEMVFTRDNQQ